MAGKLPDKNPWSNLQTVDTFDKGNHSWTTHCVEDSEIQNGGQIVGRVAPATSLLIESLIQQLCTMFEGDAVRRNKLYFAICDRLHEMKLIDSSYNMTEFEIMRGQYQIALYKLVTMARAFTGSEHPLQVPNCLMAELSRYCREFKEISFIAAGGFGYVFKARHRLDGHVYAIKKIVVRSGCVKTIMQHLEEVKTIARLNHTNIVSYKNAWIEQNFPETFVPSLPAYDSVCDRAQSCISSHTNDETTGSSNSRKSHESIDSHSNQSKASKKYFVNREISNESVKSSNAENFEYESGMYVIVNSFEKRGSSGGYLISHDIINERFHELNSTSNIIGERISERLSSRIEGNSDSDFSISFRSEERVFESDDNGNKRSAKKSSILNLEGSEESYDDESCNEEQQICQFNSSSPADFATLYIQMGLCDQTLRQWLDERSEPTPIDSITAILTQILTGLEYIHSCDIVHHDIKPSNIFISKSENSHIQLGDFGLACPLQRDDHHKMRGTPTYAAPEQLNGKCDPKSDMYSVGIVLFELLVPMETCMERSKMIEDLKVGKLPASLTANHPQWAQFIRQLVQENPQKRFTPTELLKHLNEDKDSIIAQLKDENCRKDDEINKLTERIARLEATMIEHNISMSNI